MKGLGERTWGAPPTEWGGVMKVLKTILLAGGATFAIASSAAAADLPTKKEATPAPVNNCFASLYTWLDSTPANCPLSLFGVTVYGALDTGVGYATAGSKFNPDYNNGVFEVINKMSYHQGFQPLPNGLSQSNLGVKWREQIVPDWYVIGDVNFGFDPYSLHFASGPTSLVNNNFNTLANQTTSTDSSRTYGPINNRAYAGVTNAVFGTLTVGRQNSFSNDMASVYDPTGGSYAYSLIGTSSAVLSGTGDTELARYTTSIKYQITYNNFRAGILSQLGGWDTGNNAQQAYEGDVGFDYAGFSLDAIYQHAEDVFSLATFGGAAIPTGDPSDTLKVTLENIDAVAVAGVYNWQALRFFSGYLYSNISNPTNSYGATATQNGAFLDHVNGGYPGVVQALAFPNDKHLQTLWEGVKYAVRPDLDLASGYYHEWQNNYSAAGTNCGPNKTPAAKGFSPQGAANAACAGTTDVITGMIDYRPVKRVDLYGGVMYSVVAGGMANGFLKSVNLEPSAGVRVSF
jgi:predicted porin